MKPVKSHLDFTSENQPGPCFRDLSYTPYDANITNSRRLHLAAYFKFMRPQASSLYDEYAAEARRTACKILYNDTMQRAVSAAYFEYLVDNVFWKLWFRPFGSDAPLWPWGPPKVSSRLKPGQSRSRTYDEYCESRANETSWPTRTTITISHAEPNPESPMDPKSQYIVRSQAVFTMFAYRKSESELDLDLKRREVAWEKLDPFLYEPGIVGPFEVEPPSLTPIETLVVPDLASINTLLEGHAVIKANMTRRRIIVTFPETVQDENEASQRHFIVWGHVLGWVNGIKQKKYITLQEHLQGALQLHGDSSGE
ncbi:hypothetical protein FPOA_02180 [Fusarium poae]|uniref:Uncharacterized protein n=1 Tax=Fusarium poae TaxID=36050 RepID=A0A1B8B696_FUSPO|nr:hypothetical protein FPOA_02180 [Fusarium poae]